MLIVCFFNNTLTTGELLGADWFTDDNFDVILIEIKKAGV